MNNKDKEIKKRNYEHIDHQIKYKGAKVYKDKKKEIPRKDKHKKKVDDELC